MVIWLYRSAPAGLSSVLVRCCPYPSVSVRTTVSLHVALCIAPAASRPPVLSLPFPAILPRSPWISPEKPEKIEKNLKFRLQKRNSMIYYVSVARRKRRCSEADITLKNFADRNFWKPSGFKKIEKISKTICKNKKLWYIMFLSLAKCERADWKLNSAM